MVIASLTCVATVFDLLAMFSFFSVLLCSSPTGSAIQPRRRRCLAPPHTPTHLDQRMVELVEVQVELPLTDFATLTDQVLRAITPATKLAVFDHISR